jgi:NADPH-dependent curcumin reductase CurA
MSRAWHLIRRPNGMPVASDFALVDTAPAALEPGQVRIANRWLSVDPYMRGRMSDAKSYAAPFGLNEPMAGGAVGEVIESRADGLTPGQLVQHMAGWRDEAVLNAADVQRLPATDVPPQAFLGQFGMPGMTAYFGLLSVAAAKPGDIVFVSAAAGAVGSTVVQIARANGMTVIGSAGGPAKCASVKALGADHVIDYKAGIPVADALAQVAPNGIDVYFDNVGGEHFDAALGAARLGARFAVCGMIDSYNHREAAPLRNLRQLIVARMRVEGFLFTDFIPRAGEFHRDMAAWLNQGRLRREETVVEGLENMPDAFLGLFRGENIGKMLVKLG